VLAPPTITVAPPGELTAQHGDTVVISCEATGIPTPLIVWRLNFGHVGDPPRVTYSTEKESGRPGWADERGPGVGRGQITVRQARADDEGAYTCEAINSKGNVFAVPDTVVHVLREFHFSFAVAIFTPTHYRATQQRNLLVENTNMCICRISEGGLIYLDVCLNESNKIFAYHHELLG